MNRVEEHTKLSRELEAHKEKYEESTTNQKEHFATHLKMLEELSDIQQRQKITNENFSWNFKKGSEETEKVKNDLKYPTDLK